MDSPDSFLALFSAVSTSSKGDCGQTCGRMENTPAVTADLPLPGNVWIVAFLRRNVKSVEHFSIHSFCVAVDKETRCAWSYNFGKFYFRTKICRKFVDFRIAFVYNIHWMGLNSLADHTVEFLKSCTRSGERTSIIKTLEPPYRRLSKTDNKKEGVKNMK